MSTSTAGGPPPERPAAPLYLPKAPSRVWIKAEDLAAGTLPQICCVTGDFPTSSVTITFGSPSRAYMYIGTNLGRMIRVHAASTQAHTLRVSMPVSERAVARRRRLGRGMTVLSLAFLPLLVAGLLLFATINIVGIAFGVVLVLASLLDLAGALVLGIPYVLGFGLPRGTVRQNRAGEWGVLLTNPHPKFAAAVTTMYGDASSLIDQI